MTSSFEVSEDFSRIVDILERVTLYRAGGGGSAIEVDAWRFEQKEEPLDGSSTFNRLATTWQIPVTEATRELRPGDRLRDAADRCGVIDQVEPLSGSTRMRCRVKTLGVGQQEPERFDVVRLSDGVEVMLRAAVEGVWLSQRGAIEAVTVYTLEETPIRVGDRLARSRGGNYDVQRVVTPRSLGDPWEIEVARITETTQ